MKNDLPEAHFGPPNAKAPDWRKEKPSDDRDDDEELKETPRDVIDMLGFDPKYEK